MAIRRKLPPLNALTSFEAAARLASFTKAANELGVTQAAVSHQILLLEEHFGFPLFNRVHRKVELTQKGKTLSAAARDAFDLVSSCVADISRGDHTGGLTICASVAFSQFWLLPRISEFSRQYPEIDLRILSQENISNIGSGEIDIAIRFGSGMWPDGKAELLFEDEIFPVCSPDYARSEAQISVPQDLINHPLIWNDTNDPTWTGWGEWLAAFSVQTHKKTFGLRCSFYTEAIYAALRGQGIALGWKLLVEDMLHENRLVRVTEAAVKTRNAYFVVVPKGRTRSDATNFFLTWLRTRAARSPTESAG